MSNLKMALCLLAILVAYGIAARMDYDDAVMLEQARQTEGLADCPSSDALTAGRPHVRATGHPVHSIDDSVDDRKASNDAPCSVPAL